jgi:hypothetical protein
MASTTNTMYDDLAPFFGGEAKRSRLFVALNYRGTQFTVPLNTAENPDTLMHEPVWQLMLAKNHKGNTAAGVARSTLGDKVISEDFVQFVSNVAAFHRQLDVEQKRVGFGTGTMTAETLTFKANVVDRYGELDPDAQVFFSEMVNLVREAPRLPVGVAEGITQKTRVNLKKKQLNVPNAQTIFASTLPFLPKGSTKEDGTPFEGDALQRLHKDVSMIGGGLFDGVNEWTTLDVGKFLKGVMTVQKRSHDISVTTEFGDLYDLSLDNLYTRDEKGNLLRDGKLIDDTELETSPCATTGVPTAKCEQVFECILSGDSKKLHRCLSKFRDEDMFNVANSEVKKMNPAVLVKILDTFNVRREKGVVEHYMVWLSEFKNRLVASMGEQLGTKTFNVIRENKKLLNYLHQLINVASSNPTLFGKASDLSDMPGKELKKSPNVKYFYRPERSDAVSMMPSYLDTLVNQLRILPQNLSGQYNAMLRTSGVIPSMALPLGLYSLRGGARKSNKLVGGADSTLLIKNLYKTILNDMQRRGKDLVDEDKKHIETAIKQIEENNRKLEKALRDLGAFVRLADAMDVGVSQVSLSDVENLSSKNVSSLKSTVSNLENCVGRVTRDQVGLMTSLLDQVFRPMALLTIGAPTAQLRPL